MPVCYCGVVLRWWKILSTSSTDIAHAAGSAAVADANVVSEDVLRESVGKSVVNLIHGVRDMAAIPPAESDAH
ncbi:hypothetical protein ACULNC_11425 [Shigella flexneri]